MKEEWTEKLKQKLAGHRKTPPEGLWEGISEQMDFTPASVHQSPEQNSNAHSLSPFIKRWYWAAAAAILALIGFFAFHEENSVNQQPVQAETVSQPSTSQPITPQLFERSHVAEDKPQPPKPVLAFVQTSTFHQEKKEENNPIQPEQTIQNDKNETNASSEDEQEPKPTSPLKEKMVESEKHIHHQTTYQKSPSDNTGSSHKWSLGVNASSGLLAAQTSQRTDRVYYDNNGTFNYYSPTTQEMGDYPQNNTYQSYTLTDYVSEHHLPIRFGLSFHYQLTPRIALLSGVNYTYLYSQFRIPLYQNATFDQKLHYLGIPIGVSYQLWSTNNFQFYISGNTMVEKCLNEKPWQWSVNATAGAEYSITHQFGIYLQPSLGYYFDDGTSFKHYYKKHPLAPSIEFGVRLHMNE